MSFRLVAYQRAMASRMCYLPIALILGLQYAVMTSGHLEFSCPFAVFNFGDSLSDTGNAVIAFPVASGVKAPYGQSYFQRPAGRFSDGRVLPDFFAQAFSFPLLAPYLQNFASDLSRGVNFASAGATADNDTMFSPFSLLTQVEQFLVFRRRTLNALLQQGSTNRTGCAYFSENLPTKSTFSNGMYVVSIGGNDLTTAYFRNISIAQVMTRIVPVSVESITQSVLALYDSGARSFMVLNVPAEGCSPIFLNDFGGPGAVVDELGCLQEYNNVVKEFNRLLHAAVLALRTKLFDATIIYVDYYAANIDVLSNPASYGMMKAEILKACCGTGGRYNFDPRLNCGNSGFLDGIPATATTCINPGQHVNWDGVHFTEAFYRGIATKILTGSFVDPPISLATTCGLNFSKFEDSSFQHSYPGVPSMW